MDQTIPLRDHAEQYDPESTSTLCETSAASTQNTEACRSMDKAEAPIYLTINSKQRKVTVINQSGKPLWYDLKLTIRTDPDTGRPRRKDYRAHTLQELQRAIDQDIKSGNLPSRRMGSRRITVAELTDLYLQNRCTDLEPNTAKRYHLLAVRVKDKLGKYYAADLTGSLVNAAFLQVRDQAVKDHNHQDGITAANDFLYFLSRIMDYGILLHYARQNPCHYVRRLRHVRHQKILPDLSTLSLYVSALDQEGIYGDLLAVTFLLGLRIGETQALRHSDLDQNHGRVWIRSHIVYCSSVSSPSADRHNTDKENRTSANHLIEGRKAHDEYTAILTSYVSQYIDRAIERGRQWKEAPKSEYQNPEGLIFTNARGESLLYTTIERHHRRAADTAGLPDFTIHDLRRTMASLVFEQTDSVSAVKALLGHRDANSTSRYILPTQNTYEKLRCCIDDLHKEIQQAGETDNND